MKTTVGKIFGKSIKNAVLPQLFLIINAYKTESGLRMPLGYVGSTSLIYFKKEEKNRVNHRFQIHGNSVTGIGALEMSSYKCLEAVCCSVGLFSNLRPL